ncbi:MAG TPA: arginine deiminase family protein [Vicinamibacterales bacterium]|nr:arginine deiminase family protein [Vicinamibacterales bacterium]
MRVALTRSIPPSIVRCELTHLERVEIDVARATAQHHRYEDTLRALGCTVERLADTPDLPDSLFVEDVAVALDEVAVITRPGAGPRRGETASMAEALARYRPLRTLVAPATLDGGDVLRIGKTICIGLSSRTNEEGVQQFAEAVAPFGYRVHAVPVRGCLHLKSAVTALEDAVVICNPRWVDGEAFGGLRVLEVPASEPFAANVLAIDHTLVCSAEYPRTADDLAARGYDVHRIDVSELAKAEAGVTCCSVILNV